MQQVLDVSNEVAAELAGVEDGVLDALRGNRLTLGGDDEHVAAARAVVDELVELVEGGHEIGPDTVGAVLAALDQAEDIREVFDDVVWRHRGKKIAPKTIMQKQYVDAIRQHTITFAIGPAGTGKTYLAIELAASMERGTIEVAPLAFMRGRTLNDSFIILDEAQNTTPEQMQMFLTRLGFGSRVVVTGDVTQIDLPREQASGLIHVRQILSAVDGIEFVEFGNQDVVRHVLVQRIVEAYKQHAEETGSQRPR